MIISKNYKKKRTSGFTLAELLVVVAIIAILVAVSIPIFSGRTEAAKEATCEANRRSLKAFLSNECLSNPSSELLTNGSHSLNDKLKDEYPCSDGGTLSYKIDTANNVITVYCSVHAKGSSLGNANVMDTICSTLKALGNTDSTAPDGDNIQLTKANATFAEAGISLGDFSTWSWSNSGHLYMTTQDISSGSNGPVYIMQYNSNTGNYTVWEGNIGTKTGKNTNIKYNYIQSAKSNTLKNSNVADQTYEKALEIYNSLVNSN